MQTFAFVLYQIIRALIWLIVAWALLSWFPNVNPRNPLVKALNAVVEPVLYPFQKLIPPIGPINISAIVAILVLQLIQSFVVQALMAAH
jgi:YggT family protein